MMHTAYRSLHATQGPSQNFVLKPTYLLELNLLVFNRLRHIKKNRYVMLRTPKHYNTILGI